MVFTAVVFPWLRERLPARLQRLAQRLVSGEDEPETLAYLDRDEPWADGWLGPRLRARRETAGETRRLRVLGGAELRFLGGPLALRLRVDGREVGAHQLSKSGPFELDLALPAALPAGAPRGRGRGRALLRTPPPPRQRRPPAAGLAPGLARAPALRRP